MQSLSKFELKRQIKRFHADKDRGISINLFCELAGMSMAHFLDVFVRDKEPLTEVVQIRVSKAYQQWKSGNVRVMQNKDRTRYVEYRKESKPPMMASMGLQVTSGGIKLKVGMVNRHDYSEITLDEALRG